MAPWVDIAEVTAGAAVVITLVLLIFLIAESDELERVNHWVRMAQWKACMFLQSDQLPVIAAQIEVASNPDFMIGFRRRYALGIEEAALWNRWLYLIWESLEAEYLSTGLDNQLAGRIRAIAGYEDQPSVILPLVTSSNPAFADGFTNYVNRPVKKVKKPAERFRWERSSDVSVRFGLVATQSTIAAASSKVGA